MNQLEKIEDRVLSVLESNTQSRSDDMMNWVRLMNNIRNSAQEIVKAQVIYV